MRRFYLITYVLIIGSPALPVHAQNNSLGYGVTACSEFVATYEPRQMMTIFRVGSWLFYRLQYGDDSICSTIPGREGPGPRFGHHTPTRSLHAKPAGRGIARGTADLF